MEGKTARSILRQDRWDEVHALFPSPFVEPKGDREQEAVVPSEGGLSVIVPATCQFAAVLWSSATKSVIENEFCFQNED